MDMVFTWHICNHLLQLTLIGLGLLCRLLNSLLLLLQLYGLLAPLCARNSKTERRLDNFDAIATSESLSFVRDVPPNEHTQQSFNFPPHPCDSGSRCRFHCSTLPRFHFLTG